MTIPKAGHYLPHTQLVNTKTILSDFITAGQLQCHNSNQSACLVAPIMCGYMNNCNGNGVCKENGKCSCNSGFRSADCSQKVNALTDGASTTLSLNGTQWAFFEFN